MRRPTPMVLMVVLAFSGNAPAKGPSFVRAIPLPGVEGRIDHLAYDERGQRLFVAALGNNTLEIVDVRAGKVTGRIEKLAEPQGVGYLPDSDRLMVANGKGDNVEFYDAGTLKLLKTLSGMEDADDVRYDPAARLVYIGYGGGKNGAVAAIDGQAMQKVRTYALEGHPEAFELEKKGTRIFVNVPESHQVAVIDRDKGTVSVKWKIEASANFPMALDEQNHRLFIGCRRPAKLLTLDTQSGQTIDQLKLSGDCDDLFYDEGGRVYASCGEGFLDVFERSGQGRFRQRPLPTAPGARTGLFAPSTGQFFLAVPHRGKQQAEIRVYGMREGLNAPASPRQ